MKKLLYVEKMTGDKTIILKAKIIARIQVESSNVLIKKFGATDDELEGVVNGIQSDLNSHPRINAGYLHTFVTVRREKDVVQVIHNASNKVICEVVWQEGGEG